MSNENQEQPKILQQMTSLAKNMSARQRAIAIKTLQKFDEKQIQEAEPPQDQNSSAAEISQGTKEKGGILTKSKRKGLTPERSPASIAEVEDSIPSFEPERDSTLPAKQQGDGGRRMSSDGSAGTSQRSRQAVQRKKKQRKKYLKHPQKGSNATKSVVDHSKCVTDKEDHLLADQEPPPEENQSDSDRDLLMDLEPTSPNDSEITMELKIFPVKGSKLGRRMIRVVHDDKKKRAKTDVTSNDYMVALDDGKWQCKECNKILRSKSNLLVHTRIHSGEKPFKCELCQRSFSVSSNYQRHVRVNHKLGDKWRCTLCQNLSDSHDDLKQHVAETHPVSRNGNESGMLKKVLECNQCNKTFKTKSAFVAHEVLHTGDQPHKCEFCKRAFSFKTNLIRHRKIHTGQKGHRCHLCARGFIEKKCLVQHMRRHHPGNADSDEQDVYECEVCDKQFFSNTSFTAHNLMHSGDKLFECEFCQRDFTSSANLTRHKRTHTGERPFECDICGQRFTEKRCVAVHRRLHTGEKPFSCEVCGKSFAQASTLHSHQVVHTKQRAFSCQLCDTTFLRRSHYTYHMQKHNTQPNLQCHHCDMKFYRSGELKRHMLKHTNERPYLCNMCPRNFTRLQYLKEHLNEHTGSRPFQCKHCSLTFPDSTSCYKHLRSHSRDEEAVKSAAAEHNYGIAMETGQVVSGDGILTLVDHGTGSNPDITLLKTVISGPVAEAETMGTLNDNNVYQLVNPSGPGISEVMLQTPQINAAQDGSLCPPQPEFLISEKPPLTQISVDGDDEHTIIEQEMTLEEAIEKGLIQVAEDGCSGEGHSEVVLLNGTAVMNTQDLASESDAVWQFVSAGNQESVPSGQDVTCDLGFNQQFMVTQTEANGNHAFVIVNDNRGEESSLGNQVVVMDPPMDAAGQVNVGEDEFTNEAHLLMSEECGGVLPVETPTDCQIKLTSQTPSHPELTDMKGIELDSEYELTTTEHDKPEISGYLSLNEAQQHVLSAAEATLVDYT